MTPTQRAAALRLIEFETLPRRLLDIACRVRVNECLFHDDEFVDDASHALKEAIDLLRELAAEPVDDMQKALKDAQHTADFYRRRVQALEQWQSRMRDPERTVVCDILANGFTLDPPVPHDRYALAAEPVQEPVAAELPAPQLLVESAQGFVEGWTRSQVRSAINLALLKRRYAAPQQPMRCPEDGGECGAGGYCRPEPKQRRPLTDKDIVALLAWDDYLGGCITLLEFARAIERAHGITGEPT